MDLVSTERPSPKYSLDDDDETYEPYIPVIKRRQEKLARLTSWSSSAEREKLKKHDGPQELEDGENEDELRKEKARKERTLLMEAQEVHLRKAAEG
jgi:ATP-dependent RNA helicase DDX41